jgi:hypothetical protein
MSEKKAEPILLVPQRPKNLCPVCGEAAYSPGGIHPQCAMLQADEPRLARLKARKADAPKPTKVARNVWKKKCPQCGTQSHVRLGVCKCGHKFAAKA